MANLIPIGKGIPDADTAFALSVWSHAVDTLDTFGFRDEAEKPDAWGMVGHDVYLFHLRGCGGVKVRVDIDGEHVRVLWVELTESRRVLATEFVRGQ